jgi:tight adherence protein B
MVPTLGLVGREAPDPIGREFNICFEEQNYGLELRTALGNLVTRFPLQDLRMIASAIMIQRETGGNLAEILDKCAHIIRARAQLQQEIRVRTAQGRLTGWILSFLPVILGVILYFMNPAQMSVLWKRPLGVKLLYTSAAMTTIGALIIRKIVRIRV